MKRKIITLDLSIAQIAVLGEFLDLSIQNLKIMEFEKPLNDMQEALKVTLPILEAKLFESLNDIPCSEFKEKVEQMELEIKQTRLN